MTTTGLKSAATDFSAGTSLPLPHGTTGRTGMMYDPLPKLPIMTVKQPVTILPPCTVGSNMRAAGSLPTNTVGEPFNTRSGGPLQINLSRTRACGILPTFTLNLPVIIGPPTWGVGVAKGHMCMSKIRAAGGIVNDPTCSRARTANRGSLSRIRRAAMVGPSCRAWRPFRRRIGLQVGAVPSSVQ